MTKSWLHLWDFAKNSYYCPNPDPQKSRSLTIYFTRIGVHRVSASEKSHLLRAYKILFLIVGHTQEMRYLEKCPTEPGNDDKETDPTIRLEPAHSSPHIESNKSLAFTTVHSRDQKLSGD